MRQLAGGGGDSDAGSVGFRQPGCFHTLPLPTSPVTLISRFSSTIHINHPNRYPTAGDESTTAISMMYSAKCK